MNGIFSVTPTFPTSRAATICPSATPPSPCQQESRTKASSAQRPSRLERSICGGAASSPPDACGMSPTNTQHRAVFTLFTEINRNNNYLWILVGV